MSWLFIIPEIIILILLIIGVGKYEYSLVIFSNVIIYIARIIIVSCNKDKKIKIFCMIVTGILGKATWFSILLKILS